MDEEHAGKERKPASKLTLKGQNRVGSGDNDHQDSTMSIKWQYLINQVNNLLSEITESRARTAKHKKFIYTLLAAFVAFSSAPIGLGSDPGADIRLAYGCTGFFFSLTIIYFISRHILIISSSLKNNLRYYKQINLIRGIAQRDGFLTDSDLVLPAGLVYREPNSDDPDRHPGKAIEDSKTVPLFYSFIGSFLVAASYFFLAVVWKAWPEAITDHTSLEQTVTGVNLFRTQAFFDATLAFSPVAYFYIHFQRNFCLSFHRKVWEAKRISPDRQSPKFPDSNDLFDKAIRKWYIGGAWAIAIILGLIWCLNLLFLTSPELVSELSEVVPIFKILVGFDAFVWSCVLFVIIKILDVVYRLFKVSRVVDIAPKK